MKGFQYVESLKGKRLHLCTGELLSSVWGCKRVVAQGKLPYGLLTLHNLVNSSLQFYTISTLPIRIVFSFKFHFLIEQK